MIPLDESEIRRLLPDRRVLIYDALPTTMQPATGLAADGAPAGTLVIVDEQTAGRGRHGHAWHSERGAGVYFSILLEPEPVLTLALGLAVAEAISSTNGVSCDLRWPNDVLIGGRKAAGVLVELHGGVAVAGIGVNVNQSEFPPELAPLATSLRIETGREHAREALLAAIVQHIESYCGMLREQGRAAIIRAFTRVSSYARGKRVRVEQSGAILRGVTEGLDSSGFLLVRTDDGALSVVITGGVRPE